MGPGPRSCTYPTARYGAERFALLGESSLRFMWVFRWRRGSRNLLWALLLYRMRMKYELEIGLRVDIGPGFYIGHVFNITINPAARIGGDVNIRRGLSSGRRTGASGENRP